MGARLKNPPTVPPTDTTLRKTISDIVEFISASQLAPLSPDEGATNINTGNIRITSKKIRTTDLNVLKQSEVKGDTGVTVQVAFPDAVPSAVAQKGLPYVSVLLTTYGYHPLYSMLSPYVLPSSKLLRWC